MDLDAVLARKPAVVLVDDFGQHAAAIEALREAGIDVISTVDVCDTERAAATIAGLTGQQPAATVSDAALRQADEIRFVDSSPEALRKRLGHGNIYPAGQVPEALDGLFRTSSLAALREIGLRIVAETLTAPSVTQRREPPDVLVAVADPAQADALVQRGLRLARRSGAKCTVLALRQPAGAPGGGAADIRSAAQAAGAAAIVREGPDVAATLAQAVRETGAGHLVVAAAASRQLRRWRASLVECLADQLPDVHLHITPARALEGAGGAAGLGRAGGAGSTSAGGAGSTSAGGAGGTGGTGGEDRVHVMPVAAARARGAIRLYLGYAAGCGITTAMLEEAGRRRSRGSDVVVAAVDCRGREGVSAVLDGLELIGDGTVLDADAVLARQPEVVCIDDLSVTDPGGESRFAAARRLAHAGITVIATVHLTSLHGRDGTADAGRDGSADAGGEGAADAGGEGAADAGGEGAAEAGGEGAAEAGGEGTAGTGRPGSPRDRGRIAGGPRPGSPRGGNGAAGGALDQAAVVALADEIELVDAPPSVLADRVRRGEIVPVAEIEQALRAEYAPGKLGILREQAFAVVAEHADHRLAGYRLPGVPAGTAQLPGILACAAPRVGMESLIRRSAALAAQLAGDFRVAVILQRPPSAELERLLAGYAALTAQLGGEFVRLKGTHVAAALAGFALRHQVTEIVLARDAVARPGRHRVLRELARRAGDAELHILPAEGRSPPG